jgi:hypothetical protein
MAVLRVQIDAADVDLRVELNDSHTTAALLKALPLTAEAQTWGPEVYFSVPVDCDEEDPWSVVDLGAVGYWPPGRAVCLFFGQQPVSPVNLIGMIQGDPTVLEAVEDGQLVRLDLAADAV